MKNILKAITILLLITIPSNLHGVAKYYNKKTGYNDFTINKCDNNGNLSINNKTQYPILNFINISLTENEDLTFEIRVANRNNSENKTYTYNDNGKIKKLRNPSWGIFWNYIDNNNFYCMEFKSNNSCLYDFTDERTLTINLFQIIDGIKNKIESYSFNKGYNLYEGYNSIRLISKDSEIKLYSGDKILNHIKTLKLNLSGKIGYFTGPAAQTEINRASLYVTRKPELKLDTNYSKEKIDSIFNSTEDKYEGYWEYLDMYINSSHTKLGGKYTIALIKNDIGYDIVYISGSKVNKSRWKQYMKKGKLKNTNFLDTYNLEWYDSKMNLINDETHAQVKDNSILELYFPIYKSKIRFFKRNRPQHILQPIK